MTVLIFKQIQITKDIFTHTFEINYKKLARYCKKFYFCTHVKQRNNWFLSSVGRAMD